MPLFFVPGESDAMLTAKQHKESTRSLNVETRTLNKEQTNFGFLVDYDFQICREKCNGWNLNGKIEQQWDSPKLVGGC